MACRVLLCLLVVNLCLFVLCDAKKCCTNEEYSKCVQSICRHQKCTELGSSVKCARVRPEDCRRGCVCKEDYLRAANGTCIPQNKCNLTCGENEVADKCPADCASDYCPRSECEALEECRKPARCPPPKCKCAFNHRRAKNGTCIPTRSCPSFDCSGYPNEEFNSCPPLCPTDDCSQASPYGLCSKRFGRIGKVLNCQPKCRCIKGYWRKDGICVPYGECPGVCPTNERYSYCLQGECKALNCSQKGQPIACPRIDPKYCKTGCVCQDGYLRDDTGVCVPEDKCQKSTLTCGANEEQQCVRDCPPETTCRSRNVAILCLDDGTPCQEKCVCKEGYFRNAVGDCITSEQCDQCSGDHEYFACSGACDNVCTKLYKESKVNCPIVNIVCNPMCYCEDGYARDGNGTCVAIKDCPKNPTCSDGEVVDTCPVDCPSDYCPTNEEQTKTTSCPKPKFCPPATCKCGFNSRRTDEGTCIPTRECPPFDCSRYPNEEFNSCPPLCPTDDCSQASPSGHCPKLYGHIGIVLNCQPKCRCIKGYWRKDGICVPYGECPGVCPTNERYSYCLQGECKALNCSQKDQPIACPRIDPKFCKTGCVCQDGYLRDDTGVCVPEDQCQKPTLTCGANEEPQCVRNCPPETTCRSRNIAVLCADDGTPCQEKCVCKEGYFRNAVGDCITSEQCDQCSGDHEYFACSGACDNVCTKLYKESKANCPIVNIVCNPMCYCEDGYARDGNGTCVAIKDCPKNPTCSDGEVVDTCPVDCPSDYCPTNEEQTKMTSCPKPDVCPPATCKCGFNSRRTDEDTCIPTRDCPTLECSGANQEYNTCPTSCPGEQCSQATADGECHIIGKIGIVQQCFPRCHCIKNYWRRDGECVPYDECKTCPGPHEVYKDEKTSCPPNTCLSLVAKFRCAENQPVFSGCICKSGYLRLNETQPCIKTCKCPQMTSAEQCKNVAD